MKLECRCGSLIHDGTDGLRNKAHVLPDRNCDALLEISDAAIETSGPSAKEKEAACMKVRSAFSSATRRAYQCSRCGRLYIYDSERRLQCFAPEAPGSPEAIFDV